MTARAAWQVAPGRGRGWGLFGVGLGLLVGCSSGFDPQRVVLLGMVNPQGVVLVQRAARARELYREPPFRWAELERDGVTCLGARLNFGQETYGPALVQGLAAALQAQPAGRGLVPPALAANRINAAGLTAA